MQGLPVRSACLRPPQAVMSHGMLTAGAACGCILRCRFVQCYSCGNPETVIKVRKRNELIELKCKACGAVR